MAGRTALHRKRIIMIAVFLILLTAIILFVANREKQDRGQGKSAGEPELSAWIVDWQWQSGLTDLQQLTSGLSSLNLFAAYFNEANELFVREDTKFRESLPAFIQSFRNEAGRSKLFLTLVNDRIHQDGTSEQKSSDLIDRLMETAESREKHMQQVLALIEQYQLDGVEIDYERINNSSWENLILFCEDLYQELQSQGKLLRIVLEPRAPIERLSLPEGPSYVMMAYNLYGTHSGPGPKADLAYIKKLAGRMEHLPGEPVMALATGGFDWTEGGKAAALTQQQATDLAQQGIEKPVRDKASGSLHFIYKDEAGVIHTVWYADEHTLSGWIDTARGAGIGRIALWRLGGLGLEALNWLSNYYGKGKIS